MQQKYKVKININTESKISQMFLCGSYVTIMGIIRTNPQLKELLYGINSIPASITLHTFLRFSFIQRWNDMGQSSES